MEPAPNQTSQHRGGSLKLLRRYIVVGSWVGNAVFVLLGVQFGLVIGGVAGAEYFGSLFLVDQLGQLAEQMGGVIGIIVGLFTYWAVTVIAFSMYSTFIYLAIYRSLPPRG